MKKERQQAIIDLIQSRDISTQEELKDGLQSLGYKVTQATVSRDINELELVKALSKSGNYKYTKIQGKASAKSPLEELHSLMGSLVASVDWAGNTVVIKCQTGMAQAVCAKLDAAKLPQIVGTLAGDDTIFALVRSEEAALSLVDELRNDIRA